MSDINGAAGDHKKKISYRAALTAVIILSTLIVIALIALIVGFVVKFNGKSAPAPAPEAAASFSLPEGAEILSSETQPGRLILHVRTGAGEEIDIVDTESGRLISRIKAADGP